MTGVRSDLSQRADRWDLTQDEGIAMQEAKIKLFEYHVTFVIERLGTPVLSFASADTSIRLFRPKDTDSVTLLQAGDRVRLAAFGVEENEGLWSWNGSIVGALLYIWRNRVEVCLIVI